MYSISLNSSSQLQYADLLAKLIAILLRYVLSSQSTLILPNKIVIGK